MNDTIKTGQLWRSKLHPDCLAKITFCSTEWVNYIMTIVPPDMIDELGYEGGTTPEEWTDFFELVNCNDNS